MSVLFGNHIVGFSTRWLKFCLNLQGVPQLQDQINSLVYEQWLLADLHELETRCLPSSAISADKFQLSGAFALQVSSPVCTVLNHLSLPSLLWVIGKQKSPRCDAAERGVPSGAILFA